MKSNALPIFASPASCLCFRARIRAQNEALETTHDQGHHREGINDGTYTSVVKTNPGFAFGRNHASTSAVPQGAPEPPIFNLGEATGRARGRRGLGPAQGPAPMPSREPMLAAMCQLQIQARRLNRLSEVENYSPHQPVADPPCLPIRSLGKKSPLSTLPTAPASWSTTSRRRRIPLKK